MEIVRFSLEAVLLMIFDFDGWLIRHIHCVERIKGALTNRSLCLFKRAYRRLRPFLGCLWLWRHVINTAEFCGDETGRMLAIKLVFACYEDCLALFYLGNCSIVLLELFSFEILESVSRWWDVLVDGPLSRNVRFFLLEHAFVVFGDHVFIREERLHFLTEHVAHGLAHFLLERVEFIVDLCLFLIREHVHLRELLRQPRVHLLQVHLAQHLVFLVEDLDQKTFQACMQHDLVLEGVASVACVALLGGCWPHLIILFIHNVERLETSLNFIEHRVADQVWTLDHSLRNSVQIGLAHGLGVENL